MKTKQTKTISNKASARILRGFAKVNGRKARGVSFRGLSHAPTHACVSGCAILGGSHFSTLETRKFSSAYGIHPVILNDTSCYQPDEIAGMFKAIGQ